MKKLLVYVVLLFATIGLWADEIPNRPAEQTLVNDLANVFTPRERQYLEQKLVSFFAQTSNQIAVVTVPTLDGYEIADYAARLGEKWGIGKKEYNNGVLILIKPKTATERGEVNISVGYGLEGVIPDAITNQIIDNEIIPEFKSGAMLQGVDNAVDVISELASGEYSYEQYAKQAGGSPVLPFIFMILMVVVLPLLFGRRRGGVYAAGGRNSSLPFWVALGLLNSGRSNHGGMFGDFSSGSGSFGGGGNSFGSFGGFGGGSFGGGGSSGSW